MADPITLWNAIPTLLKLSARPLSWVASLFSEDARLKRNPIRIVVRDQWCHRAPQSDGRVLTQLGARLFVTNVSERQVMIVNVFARPKWRRQLIHCSPWAPSAVRAGGLSVCSLNIMLNEDLIVGKAPLKITLVFQDNLQRNHFVPITFPQT